jgi:hypothetical protein
LLPGAIGDSQGEDHWRLCESDRSEALHYVKPGLAVERDGRTGPAFVQAPDPLVRLHESRIGPVHEHPPWSPQLDGVSHAMVDGLTLHVTEPDAEL